MSRNINPMSGRCRHSKKIYDEVIKKCGCPNSILELGCGIGLNLRAFINTPIKIGIDPLENNVRNAIKNNPDAKIIMDSHFYLKNFKDKEFDVGITCSVIDHIEDFEIALNDLMRVCGKLVLIEPMIDGVNRQALPSETRGWDNTWYFDYIKFFNSKNVEFTVEKSPLYAKNSGPLYHLFFIRCK